MKIFPASCKTWVDKIGIFNIHMPYVVRDFRIKHNNYYALFVSETWPFYFGAVKWRKSLTALNILCEINCLLLSVKKYQVQEVSSKKGCGRLPNHECWCGKLQHIFAKSPIPCPQDGERDMGFLPSRLTNLWKNLKAISASINLNDWEEDIVLPIHERQIETWYIKMEYLQVDHVFLVDQVVLFLPRMD